MSEETGISFQYIVKQDEAFILYSKEEPFNVNDSHFTPDLSKMTKYVGEINNIPCLEYVEIEN